MDWQIPQKPAEITENRLIQAILQGQFPIDSNLPAERELAGLLGVTRPTLRETLQRLSRDGWLEIRHGKPTRVRNYWQEGNLGVLASLAQNPDSLPQDFPANMLVIRSLLAPEFTRLAVERQAGKVDTLLMPYSKIPDEASIFADWDWRLQIQLTILSGNPVFTLIYNGFSEMYAVFGLKYFQKAENRENSRQFYRELLTCARRGDAAGACQVVRKTMVDSQELWRLVSTQERDQ